MRRKTLLAPRKKKRKKEDGWEGTARGSEALAEVKVRQCDVTTARVVLDKAVRVQLEQVCDGPVS